MHKHLKSSVTAAMVAGGLLGVGTQAAYADSILFPYLNSNAGVFSFVTIANEGLNEFSTLTGLHFTYGHKPNPVANRRGCTDLNFNVVSTPGDMMTFEVKGVPTESLADIVLFESGTPLGVDPPNTSDVPFRLPAGQTAFLSVSPIGNATASEISSRIEMWGWAEVIDTAANLTLAYSTHNLGVNGGSGAFPNPNYATSQVGNVWHRWSWYPTTFVTTSWYVLPLGQAQTMANGGIRAVLQASNGAAVGGAWDRDERFISAGKLTGVRCLGFVTRGDILSPGAVGATNDGGFAYVESFGSQTLPVTDPDDPGGVYSGAQQLNYKVQTATAATGLAPRTAINREPALNPNYAVTLDAGP